MVYCIYKKQGEIDMKRLIMMVGIQGSGKSTWVNKNKGAKEVISLDTIKEEVAGTLENYYQNEKEYKSEVNKEFQSRLSKAQAGEDSIIIDNMNLSRRKRRAIYDQFKNKGFEVEIVWMHKPLEVCIENDSKREGAKRLGRDIITDAYKWVEVPRLGVDCDKVVFEGYFYKGYLEEIYEHLGESHESPYHLETIEEHINMTLDNATTEELKELARFHDLGKSVCKKEDKQSRLDKDYYREHVGRYCTYIGHDKVSACYYLAYMMETGATTDREWMILEAIYQHMRAHQGISEKVKEQNKLTEKDLELIEEFRKVDSISKKVDKEMTDKLEALREEGIKR